VDYHRFSLPDVCMYVYMSGWIHYVCMHYVCCMHVCMYDVCSTSAHLTRRSCSACTSSRRSRFPRASRTGSCSMSRTPHPRRSCATSSADPATCLNRCVFGSCLFVCMYVCMYVLCMYHVCMYVCMHVMYACTISPLLVPRH
jgi:hypothetical protein